MHHHQSEQIKKYILDHVQCYPNAIVKKTMEQFSVSRTTVNRHIQTLIKNKKLIQSGKTRNVHYILPDAVAQHIQYEISVALDEFAIFDNHFSAFLTKIDTNLESILAYVITEMINNAKDHSQGDKLTLIWKKKALKQKIIIKDNGIGIFKKLADFCKVQDQREAILHLSKGKLTTDPSHHTGEGIFFSSRIVDAFSITSNGLKYIRNNQENDWLIESGLACCKGTMVEVIMDNHPKRDLTSIFRDFQEQDSLKFNRTEIKVDLSRLGGEKYISRSQAKRILVGLEGFDIIILDFGKVTVVGQGFVDEVFRVYQNHFPEKSIQYINANDDVTFMIKRSLA